MHDGSAQGTTICKTSNLLNQLAIHAQRGVPAPAPRMPSLMSPCHVGSRYLSYLIIMGAGIIPGRRTHTGAPVVRAAARRQTALQENGRRLHQG
jgi:hypothetical protein